MKTKTLFCIAAAAALPVFLAAPGRSTKEQRKPFTGVNYAHRGLHTKDKSVPENSLEAFRLAAEAGYGVELDVQLSKDGHVVVFHDDTLDRVCGIHGNVDDYTLAQLQSFSLCGTEHTIPLFTDVLKTIGGHGAIVCELKSGRRNRELCRKTYDIIKGYHGPVCIESFDPNIVTWFRFHAKELVRGQLAMPAKSYGESRILSELLSRCLFNFAARPQFIAYKICPQPLSVRLALALGAMDICWTSHDVKNEKGRDAVIFEFYRPETRFR